MPEGEFEVKPVAYYTSGYGELGWQGYSVDRGFIGYLPMIFGTSWFGGHSVLCSAVSHLDVAWKDPDIFDLYGSKEEAMNAWEMGKPIPVPQKIAGMNKLTSETQNTIIELGLYREVKK